MPDEGCSILEILTEASDVDYWLASQEEVPEGFTQDDVRRARCHVSGEPLRDRLSKILTAQLARGWRLPPPPPDPWQRVEAIRDVFAAGPQPEPPTRALLETAADARRTMAGFLRTFGDSLEAEANALEERAAEQVRS